jgi:hypothetical protein
MSLRERSVESSLDGFLDSFARRLHTAYPASVVAYDPEKKTCTVKVHYADFYASDGDEPIREDWPPIEDVPVLFPRGGGFSITWPLAKNDPVLLVFCERSIDQWFGGNGAEDISPELLVTHDASDCIAIPGLFPSKAAEGTADDANLILSHADGAVDLRLTPEGEIQAVASAVRLGTLSAAKSLALTEKVDARLTSLQAKVDTLVAGANAAVAAGGLWLTPQTPLGALASVNSETVFTDN